MAQFTVACIHHSYSTICPGYRLKWYKKITVLIYSILECQCGVLHIYKYYLLFECVMIWLSYTYWRRFRVNQPIEFLNLPWMHICFIKTKMDTNRRMHIENASLSWTSVEVSSDRYVSMLNYAHDAVIKWKHFPRYWPFVLGIHRWPVNFPHKGQWRGALMFSLICVWLNGWVNNREAGDLRRHRAHYNIIVMRIVSVHD